MEKTTRIDTVGDFNIWLIEQTDQKMRGRIQDLNYMLSRALYVRDGEYAFFSNLTKWLNELSTDLKKLEK